MITKFGKELRKIRIDHGEILRDMAIKLRVSPSFLSAVEVGKKNVPDGWVEKISTEYELSRTEYDELAEAAQESVTSIKINLLGSEQSKRKAALIFARDFGDMSDDTAKKIIQLLNK